MKLDLPSRDDVEVGMPLTPNTPLTPLTPCTEQFYRSIFDKADSDGDGFVDLMELRTMIQTEQIREVPLEIVRKIHTVSDRNRDGLLSFPEFYTMIKNPEWHQLFGVYVRKYVDFIVPRRRRRAGLDVWDGSYDDEYAFWPPRLGMIVISLVEVAFFVYDEHVDEGSTWVARGPAAQAFVYDPARRLEIWRYLTYMFVHIGHMHLVLNLFVQILVGVPLELVHGWWRVLTVYFAGVVAGSLATTITDPYVKLAGASGGVYSLMTAHIATIIMNWSDMTFPLIHLLMFSIIITVDVGYSMYNRYVENVDEHIGYIAHFAGAIAGLLVGINILRNLKVTKKETIIWWISLVVYIALMGAAIVWNVTQPNYFPPSQL